MTRDAEIAALLRRRPRVSDAFVLVESTAEFSACRRYRYALRRRFAEGPSVLFVGLNPSTADEHADDNTIRRCLGFAKRHGYGELLMGNLYAWRATDPRELRDVQGPVGEFGGIPARSYGPGNFNDWWLEQLANDAALIVAAWGANPGPISWRPERVLDVLRAAAAPIVALALTKQGAPRHPLYVKADADPIPYPPEVLCCPDDEPTEGRG